MDLGFNILCRQAMAVAGTEAASFALEPDGRESLFRPVAHIRHDNANFETRARAISAFQQIIEPCATQRKDGAIELQSGDRAPHPQFCLVTLIRSGNEILRINAVITRCENLRAATNRLKLMQAEIDHYPKCKICGAVASIHVVAATPTAASHKSNAASTEHYCKDHAPAAPESKS